MKRTLIIAAVAIFGLLTVISAIYFSNNGKAAYELPPLFPFLSGAPFSKSDAQYGANVLTESVLNAGNDTPATAIPLKNTSDYDNKTARISESTVLIDELENRKGLFYLGITESDIISLLFDKGIYFTSANGPLGNSDLIRFSLFGDEFRLLFYGQKEQLIDISVSGSSPVRAATTQSGLKLGDTYEKMVALYGGGYISPGNGHTYQYQLSDRYLKVYFQSNNVNKWEVWGTSFECLALGDEAKIDCIKHMFGGYMPGLFIKAFGEPEQKEDLKGFDRWYFKQGIEIDVQPLGDGIQQLTNYIYIGNQCELKTDRNIGIGSSDENVLEAYRAVVNPELTNNDLITIGAGDIYFAIRNHKVSSFYISIGSYTKRYLGSFIPDRP